MIHGDMDERIPPWEAYELESHLKGQKVPIEFKMYQRMGHCLVPANPLDILDATRRIDAFLQKHLKVD
jgi:dipeptidyl aminopeptidase/acylaminoacyl peptidase